MSHIIRKQKQIPIEDRHPLALPFNYLIRYYPESAQAKRVERILELLYAVQNGMEHPDEWWWESVRSRVALGKLLNEYHYKFSCEISDIAGEVLVHSWMVPADRETPLPDLTLELSAEELDVFLNGLEYSAVEEAMKLAGKPGGLDRVRKCKMCKRIFFALKRFDQIFCGNVCRQQNYDSNPVNREKKLATMRNNYKDEKDRAKRNEKRIDYVSPREKRAIKRR